MIGMLYEAKAPYMYTLSLSFSYLDFTSEVIEVEYDEKKMGIKRQER